MKNPANLGGSSGAGSAVQFELGTFSPKIPECSSNAVFALALLLADCTLTSPEFQSLTQSWRLAAYVHTLRRNGWRVETVMIPALSPKRPFRKIARYVMPDAAIQLEALHYG
jgi:hypothetical protein